MRNNLVFHIVLFILIIVLVGLFLYSENLLQEGLKNPTLTSKQILQLQKNVMLGVYYASDNAMRDMMFHPYDMTTTFCSQGGIKSGTTDIPTIVEKVLPSLDENNSPFIIFFNNFKKKLIESLRTKNLNFNSTNEKCLVFDRTMNEVAKQFSIADVFDKKGLQDAISSIVSAEYNKNTSEYQTVDSVRTFVKLFMAEDNFKTIMDKKFVDIYFPTEMLKDDEFYHTYAKDLKHSVKSAIRDMFTFVDFSKYMEVDIPRAIVSGQMPQGTVQRGDPGTMFTYSLSQDYSGNKMSPRSYCKSGLFRSISTPQDKMGDSKHFICL